MSIANISRRALFVRETVELVELLSATPSPIKLGELGKGERRSIACEASLQTSRFVLNELSPGFPSVVPDHLRNQVRLGPHSVHSVWKDL